MRVRCVKIFDARTDDEIPEQDGIRIGTVYSVLEMVTGPDYWMIRVLDEDDHDDPGGLWDPAMFETVDAQVPPTWTLLAQGRAASGAPGVAAPAGRAASRRSRPGRPRRQDATGGHHKKKRGARSRAAVCAGRVLRRCSDRAVRLASKWVFSQIDTRPDFSTST